MRGGGWYDLFDYAFRSAIRGSGLPGNTQNNVGFRVAMPVPMTGTGLAVTITGLQAGLDADVTVTGPNSYSQHLTATQTLTSLTDGTYTITAATVTDPTQPGLGRGNGGTLGPAKLQRYPLKLVQTVTVSGGAATVTVDYPAATLTVQIPTKEDASVSVPMDFVLVPAGSFTMGSNASPDGYQFKGTDTRPIHTVTIGKAFYVAKTELTVAQWRAVMGATNNHSMYGSTYDTYPVWSVSWDEIEGIGFLNQLNVALPTYGFRLPSEAEWEYACRAGTVWEYFFGVGLLSTYAATTSNESVATLAPNPWGLYDIIGNNWEWTEDDFHYNYNGAPVDGSAWVDTPRGTDRALRGGGWISSTGNFDLFYRSAFRDYSFEGDSYSNFGFRLVFSASRVH
jgi:formylglycine-generating enzyme required for sulfatase activity